MGILKGKKQWEKFKKGGKLTRKEAMLAMCYECNGYEESGHDCMQDEPNGILSCPLYQYAPYRPKKQKKGYANLL